MEDIQITLPCIHLESITSSTEFRWVTRTDGFAVRIRSYIEIRGKSFGAAAP